MKPSVWNGGLDSKLLDGKKLLLDGNQLRLCGWLMCLPLFNVVKLRG